MTSYEIAARHRTGHMLLIGYTPHKSRPGLLAAVRDQTPEIIAVFGTRESNEIITETQPPHCCRIGEWSIVFHWPRRSVGQTGRRTTVLS